MSIVAAFLVHGHPLPFLDPANPPWKPLAEGYRAAAERLRESGAEVVIAYSTQWFAVLDELWQAREHLEGVHVDENWYDYGDLPFDIRSDAALAHACAKACREAGISAKTVDYDGFPIDTGTIVMASSLDPGRRLRFVLAANNLYHDWATTLLLGQIAAGQAAASGRRVAIVGVGGLSGSIFRNEIDVAEDRLASDADDAWNRKLLAVLERGDAAEVSRLAPQHAQGARADMGLKHVAWLLGALGSAYGGARALGYGPAYGSGNAVIEFTIAQ